MASHRRWSSHQHHRAVDLEDSYQDSIQLLLTTLESEIILLSTVPGMPTVTRERLAHLVATLQAEYAVKISATQSAGDPNNITSNSYSSGVMAPSSSTATFHSQQQQQQQKHINNQRRSSSLQRISPRASHTSHTEGEGSSQTQRGETPIAANDRRSLRQMGSTQRNNSTGSTTPMTGGDGDWSAPLPGSHSHHTDGESTPHGQHIIDDPSSDRDDGISTDGGIVAASKATVSPRHGGGSSGKPARSPRSIVAAPAEDDGQHRKATGTSGGGGGLVRMGSRKSLIPTLPPAHHHHPPHHHGGGRPTSSPQQQFVNNGSIVSSHGYGSYPAAASAPAPPSTFGHCLTAAVHMSLEALLVMCEAERLALYTKTSNGASLELAIAVGAGVPPARKGMIASPVGLVQAVFTTCIAVNLNAVTYEDVAECPGPTAGKNALLFPVIYTTPAGLREPQGVIILINKRHGQQPFGDKDEYLLNMRIPMLSYQLWRYPLEHAAFTFDAAPLHRLAPLPSYTAPLMGIPKELSDAPDHVQKVYHRNGAEKFIRRQALVLTDDIVQAPSTAESVSSVEAYISVLEDCWKRGIHDRIEVELTLRQKMQHLSDAREILVRKQKKFDILKETLCEQLENNLASVGGGQFSSTDAGSRRSRRR